MFQIVNEKNNFLAYASSCKLNSYNNRPNVGMIYINYNNLKLKEDRIRSLKLVVFHEIFHVLAFSPKLYGKFAKKKVSWKKFDKKFYF